MQNTNTPYGLTYLSNCQSVEEIINPHFGHDVDMQCQGFLDEIWVKSNLDYNYFGYGLEKTINNKGLIFCNNANKVVSLGEGYVSLVLSLPEIIDKGVLQSLRNKNSYVNSYILWGINVGNFNSSQPGMYAALTTEGIQWTIYSSYATFTITDDVSNIPKNTPFLYEWVWKHTGIDNIVSGNFTPTMLMRYNKNNVVVGNPPISDDDIQNVNFCILNTPYQTSNLQCKLHSISTYKDIPSFIEDELLSSSSSSGSSSSSSSSGDVKSFKKAFSFLSGYQFDPQIVEEKVSNEIESGINVFPEEMELLTTSFSTDETAKSIEKIRNKFPQDIYYVDSFNTRTLVPKEFNRFIGNNFDSEFVYKDHFIHNSIYNNIDLLIDNPSVFDLERVFDGCSAIVVGAGPSLNSSLEILRSIQNSFVVISTGAALPTLLKNNINPALVIDHNFERDCDILFPEIKKKKYSNTYAIFPAYSCRKNIEKFKGVFFAYNKHNVSQTQRALFTFLEEQYDKSGSILSRMYGCGGAAIDIAVQLGCKEVILMGMDLSYEENGPTHAQHSRYHNQDSHNWWGSSTVKGNLLNSLTTRRDFGQYIKKIEEYVQSHPDVNFINANNNGAKIKGTQFIKYEDLLSYRHENINATYIVNSIYEKNFSRSNIVIEYIQNNLYLIDSLKMFFYQWMNDCLKLYSKYKNSRLKMYLKDILDQEDFLNIRNTYARTAFTKSSGEWKDILWGAHTLAECAFKHLNKAFAKDHEISLSEFSKLIYNDSVLIYNFLVNSEKILKSSLDRLQKSGDDNSVMPIK